MQVAFATENLEKSTGINLDIMTQKVWMKVGDNPLGEIRPSLSFQSITF